MAAMAEGAKPKPGGWSFFLVPQKGNRSSNTWAICLFFSKDIIRELDWKWSSLDIPGTHVECLNSKECLTWHAPLTAPTLHSAFKKYLIMYLLMYLKGRTTESTGLLPQICYSSQAWARLHLGARIYIVFCHVFGRSPGSQTIFWCHRWHISRKLDQKQGSRDLIWPPLIWDDVMANSGLIQCPQGCSGPSGVFLCHRCLLA